MQKVSTLVSTGWVAKQIQSKAKNFCILDASWHLPSANRNPLKDYQEKHIPGALFFDLDKCSAPGGLKNLSHTLPSPDAFADFVGKLGIGNESHVVIYENNAKFGIFSAARAWWMFRIFGHASVSVLDGGLPLWIKEERDTTDAIPECHPVQFKASYLTELYKSFSDIEANLETEAFQVMDARSAGRYKGLQPEPRKGVESGHMPRSVSLPFPTLTHEEDGTMKLRPPDELREAIAGAGLDLSQPLVASCGSGVTACVLALGAYLAGKEDVAVFDGAWEEFYIRMKDTKPENILKG